MWGLVEDVVEQRRRVEDRGAAHLLAARVERRLFDTRSITRIEYRNWGERMVRVEVLGLILAKARWDKNRDGEHLPNEEVEERQHAGYEAKRRRER